MKLRILGKVLLKIGFTYSVFFCFDANACGSNSDCNNNQVCCYVDSWVDSQSCGGSGLCGVGGGYCCVNPGCISGCENASKKHPTQNGTQKDSRSQKIK